MAHSISVLLVGSSEDFMETLSRKIHEQDDMVLLATADDGETAVSMVQTMHPQVLITDILLRRLDGVGVLKELRRSGSLPHTIVVSAFLNDAIASEIGALGVSYCFPKPCRISELINRIRECVHDGPLEQSDCSYDVDIAEALINFGVMPHLQGYRFLRESIRRNIESDVLHGITKILYPDLAKAFHTTSKCVERAMRNAVDAAWNHGDAERRNAYFGDMTMLLTSRPTNSRFISMMTEFILLHQPKDRRDGLGRRA